MRMIFVVWLWLVGGVAFSQNVYEHQLKNFGKTEAECREEISEVADRFEADAGVSVLGSDCLLDPTFRDNFNGRITYVSATPVKIFEADNFGNSLELAGVYQSKAQCESDRGRVEKIFTDSSGLKSFATWCYETRSSSGHPLYAYSLHAVGETEVKRQIVGASLDGYPATDSAELLREIQENIVTTYPEIHPVGIAMHNHMWMRHIRFEFFSKQQLLLKLDRSLFAENEETCKDIAKSLTTILDGKVLSAFCIKDQLPNLPFQANILSLSAGFDIDKYRLQAIAREYMSRSECENTIPSILAQLSPSTLGAVCSYKKNGKFQIQVFNSN